MKQYKGNIFADENDIYMALHSNKNKITDAALRKLAFERGILFSEYLKREDLIEQISQLPFGYSQIKALTNKLVPKINRDQYSIKRIINEFDFRHLDAVLEYVIQSRPASIGNEQIVGDRSDLIYSVDIDYVDFDFTKGRFQQKRSHSGFIRFIKSKEHVSIHYTYTPRIETILNALIEQYKKNFNDKIELIEVDLSYVSSSKERSGFIERIIRNEKSIFLGSEKLRVSKTMTPLQEPAEKSTGEMEEFESLDEEILLDNDEDSDSENKDEEFEKDNDSLENESKKIKVINNASFDGYNLDDIDDISKFYELGYFPSRVKWRHKTNILKNNPIIVIELAFDDRHLGKYLKFRILGKHEIDAKGTESAKLNIDGVDFDKIMFYLESVIFYSYDKIDNSVSEIIRSEEDK